MPIVTHLPWGCGLSIGLLYARPSWDHWPHYWYAQAFGLCLWHDTSKPLTVGQRGVW